MRDPLGFERNNILFIILNFFSSILRITHPSKNQNQLLMFPVGCNDNGLKTGLHPGNN